MSNAKNIIKNLMEDNLVDTKKLIKQTLIQRIGVMLESKIEEVAPSMISERSADSSDNENSSDREIRNRETRKKGKPNFTRIQPTNKKSNKKDSSKLDEEYELFVDEVQEIVEEIEEETGEELSDEEIKTLGEEYLKYLLEETT
jgi:hypothetical protein